MQLKKWQREHLFLIPRPFAMFFFLYFSVTQEVPLISFYRFRLSLVINYVVLFRPMFDELEQCTYYVIL